MKRSILITLICILAVSTAIVIICYQRSHAEEPAAAQPAEQVEIIESAEPTEPAVIDAPTEAEEPAEPTAPAQKPAAQKQQPAEPEELVFTTEYIDLGLPSHTRWRGINEDCGLISYEDAVAIYKSKLPNKDQLIELRDRCEWTITEQGYKVTGPNGNYIILPAEGYRNCSGQLSGIGVVGSYWSSTKQDAESAWRIGFEPGKIKNTTKISVTNHLHCYGRSIRLVK